MLNTRMILAICAIAIIVVALVFRSQSAATITEICQHSLFSENGLQRAEDITRAIQDLKRCESECRSSDRLIAAQQRTYRAEIKGEAGTYYVQSLQPVLTHKDVKNYSPTVDEYGQPAVSLEFGINPSLFAQPHHHKSYLKV